MEGETKLLTTDQQFVYASKLDFTPSTDYVDISSQFKEQLLYRPVNSIANDTSLIEFDIPPCQTGFIDITQLTVHVRIKITDKDGLDIPNDIVCLANNTLHSLFKNVQILANDKIIASSEGYYAYQAMLYQLLNRDEECSSSGFWIESGTGEPSTAEVQKRKQYFIGSKEVEYADTLKTDLSSLRRLLPNDVAIKIRLERSPREFVLLAPANNHTNGDGTKTSVTDYKVKLTDIFITVPKYTLSPTVQSSVLSVLNSRTTAFDFSQTVIKSMAIPQNAFTMAIDRLFVGKLPDKLIMAFTNASAYRGDVNLNPFHFDHLKVSKLLCAIDESQSVTRINTYDFVNEHTLAGYLDFKGIADIKTERIINKESWAAGKTLYAFDIETSLDSHFKPLSHTGTIRIEATFQEAVKLPMVCLFFGIYKNNRLYMDNQRQFTL